MDSGSPERSAVPSLHAASVVLFLLQTQCEVMNEERTELWLWQIKHIRHFITFYNSQPGHGGDRKTFEVMTMT